MDYPMPNKNNKEMKDMTEVVAVEESIDSVVIASKRIHVMHVIDKLSVAGSKVHGIGKAIEWWIPRFDPNVFSFSVVSLRGAEPFGEVLQAQGATMDFLDRGKFSVATLFDIVRLIRKHNTSVLHLHGFGASNFGRLASLITGVPCIVHEHCVFDDQPLYQTVADRLLAPLTDCSMAVSKRVAQYMIDKRSTRESTLHTFFFGLPLEEFAVPDAAEVADFKNSLNLPDGHRLVGSVGRLDTQKGFIYLLQAALHIIKNEPDVTFLIVGEGPGREKLEAFVNEHGLQKQVIFTGYRTDIVTVMSACDIIAIPSLYEGGPITLFEAMCLGKAVVATPVGVIDEVLIDGESGFLVPCKDDVALADRIQKLLADPQRVDTIGKNAQRDVQNYDISTSVKKLTAIYDALVTRST